MVGADRVTQYRMRKQLDEAQHQALLLKDSLHSRRTLKDLYHELEAAVVSE
jgi:hypothetical protein